MITALLIFFALILEYVYDPVSNMKNTAVIDATFEKFRNLVNNYIDNKYYVLTILNNRPYSIFTFIYFNS